MQRIAKFISQEIEGESNEENLLLQSTASLFSELYFQSFLDTSFFKDQLFSIISKIGQIDCEVTFSSSPFLLFLFLFSISFISSPYLLFLFLFSISFISISLLYFFYFFSISLISSLFLLHIFISSISCTSFLSIFKVASFYKIDANKVEEEKRLVNARNLMGLTYELVSKLGELEKFPRELCEIVLLTNELISTKFVGRQEFLTERFLITTFISPSISFPEGFHILGEGVVVPLNIRKTLLIISQLLSSLSKGRDLGESKELSIFSNLKQEEKKVNQKVKEILNNLFLCHSFSTPSPSPSPSLSSSSSSSSCDVEEEKLLSLQELHRLLSFNLSNISKKLNLISVSSPLPPSFHSLLFLLSILHSL